MNRDSQSQTFNKTRDYLESMGIEYNPDTIYTNCDLNGVKEIEDVSKIAGIESIKTGILNMINTVRSMIVLLIAISAILWITIVAGILGLPLGYLMTDYIFVSALGENYDFPAVIGILTYVYSAIGTFIVSFVVNVFLAKKVKNIDMVTSLKGNE